MAQFKTYKRSESIKARKVTERDGEDVVTSLGVTHAAKGDYVILRDNGLTVATADDFNESGWKSPAKPAKKSAKKSAPAPKKSTETAADRVRARAATSRR